MLKLGEICTLIGLGFVVREIDRFMYYQMFGYRLQMQLGDYIIMSMMLTLTIFLLGLAYAGLCNLIKLNWKWANKITKKGEK